MPDGIAASVTPIDQPPEFSDDALALAFAERHEKGLRYVATWGKWLEWTGTHWRPETTLHAYDLARHVCRVATRDAGREHEARKLASAATVAAVERMARADRRLAVRVEDFDADPWLLATPGGTVDLRTGELRDADRSDMITKVTAVGPGKDGCPVFLGFLDRIFSKDAELIAFISRMLGYALTGSTREHALFYGHGEGGNGKTTLINTAAGILGDYTKTAPMEMFMASRNERHPADLAMLRGARLVTASETEGSCNWAESKIKTLTGGEPITARHMHGEFFTYAPTFKLLLSGNHKPTLKNVDEAIRRRFNLIPFNATIPAEERDPDLAEKLKVEWPGILAWMITGAVEWYRTGLNPPAAVRTATDEYLAEEDALGTWLAEHCERDHKAFTATADLYAAWSAWCERTGEHPGKMKKFSTNLAKPQRGLTKDRDSSSTRQMGFYGLRLLGG